ISVSATYWPPNPPSRPPSGAGSAAISRIVPEVPVETSASSISTYVVVFIRVSRTIARLGATSTAAAWFAKYTVPVEHRTNPTELLDAEMHRRIAARIRRNPGVIAQTRTRLAKVMAEEAPYVDPVLREWL